MRCRLRPPRGAGYRIVSVTVAMVAGLAGAAVGGLLSSYPGPPNEADAVAAAALALGQPPRRVVVLDNDLDHTDGLRLEGHPGSADPGTLVRRALDRLTAAGWLVAEPLRHQEDRWDPCPAPDCSPPMSYDSFVVTDGNVAMLVAGSVEGRTGANPTLGVTVTKRLSVGPVISAAVGMLAGLLAGWLIVTWASHRYRRHTLGRRVVILVAVAPALLIGAQFVAGSVSLVTGLSVSGGWTANDVLFPAAVLGLIPGATFVLALSAAAALAFAGPSGSPPAHSDRASLA